MCGITGIIKATLLSENDITATRQMSAAMLHRGPDGSGEYFDTDGKGDSAAAAHLFMAMRRLSIIDLAGGWQPLFNEDRTVAVIVNGEIYNHVELRAELIARGHVLRTGSDCEVITHLYEDHGLDFVLKLRGMFAFALWDTHKRRLVLGRDRMGEKPLYLHITPERILFSSEMKSLLASNQLPFTIDPAGVNAYLHYGWIPEPHTAVIGVRKLLPGHLLIIDVDSWSHNEKCYWRIEDSPAVHGNPKDLVRAELEVIGTQIVRSDVPIGIALSGGFDSSLTAAIATRHSTSLTKAFTVGYEGNPGQDERQLAIEFAQHLNMPHQSIEIALSDMVAGFPKLAFDRDDPIADIAGYGYYILSQQARAAGCPVLLQGQGVDELLWGYPWAVQAVTHSLRKFGKDPVRAIEALWAQRPRNLSRPQLVRFAYLLGGILAGWRTLSPGANSPPEQLVVYDLTDPYQIGAFAARSTYTREFAERVRVSKTTPDQFFHFIGDGSRVDIQIIALLCRGYLLQNGLAQGDRLSMANSVELRLPLVDYRLAELLIGLQKHTPVYFEKPKAILHDAACDLLPTNVLNRAKRGFNPPVAAWVAALRTAYSKELCNGMLVEYGILDPAAAKQFCTSTSRFGAAADLFQKYLVLEFWYRGMHFAARKH